MLDLRECIRSFSRKDYAFLRKRYVIHDDINEFSIQGMVKLYHPGAEDRDQLTLHPGKEPEQTQHAQAEFPRVFLYLDPSEMDACTDLFNTQVDIRSIYNIPVDSDGIVYRWKSSGLPLDTLYQAIKDAGYLGHYTSGRGFDCVEWYYPIVVNRVGVSK